MQLVTLADALNILEASLGLSAPASSHYQRVMEYYSAIQKTSSTFFKESFLKDPLYVTSYLLQLRDELMLNGWTGRATDIKRLDDMAQTEGHFKNNRGYPDRLKAAVVALKKPRQFKLPPIQLVFDGPSLSKLEQEFVTASGLSIAETKNTSHDISYFEFSNSYDSGRALTNYLLNQQKNWKKIAVIVPSRSSDLVRQYFKRAGIPYGSTDSLATPFTSHVQVIVALMNLSLLPKNPEIALKLLSLEVSPVKHAFLANALRNTPSFESEDWKTAIAKLEGMEEKVKDWILDGGSSDAEAISKEVLTSKLKKLKNWFVVSGQMKKDETYLRSSSVCEELAVVIQNWSQATISFGELQKILRDVLSEGIKKESVVAQAGGPRLFSSPGEINQSFDEIIWFDFSDATAKAKFTYIWSPTELSSMRKLGMTFHSTETLTKAALSQWSRPLQSGPVKAFFSVTSPDGSKEGLHPLYYYKKKDFENFDAKVLNKENVVPQMWPAFTAQGEIKIAAGSMYLPETFSYSSLNNLLSCSARYYFEKTLKLNDHDSESLVPGNLLYGNILHKVMELGYKDKIPVGERPQLIERVINEFAPILSSQAFTKKKVGLQKIIAATFKQLDTFMEKNSLEFMDAEVELSKSFISEHKLYGEIDMLLGRNGKIELILDFKYSNVKKHQAMFADKRAIQLSLYSHLTKDKGIVPGVAYYIATDEKFIANRNYEGALYLEMDTNELVEYVQNKAEMTVKDLKAGVIRINGLSDVKEKVFPSECGYCSYQKVCGKAWGDL